MWTKLLLLFLYLNGILTQDFLSVNETDCADVTDLIAYSKSEKYIKLSWTPVANVSSHRIDYYYYKDMPYHKDVNATFCKIWKNKYCADLMDIQAESAYIVSVKPIIDDEFCPPKQTITVVTNISESSNVVNFQYKWTYHILNLTWNHPEQTNGDLTKFVITLKGIYDEINKTYELKNAEQYNFLYYKEIPLTTSKILENFPCNASIYAYNGFKGKETQMIVLPPKNAIQLATRFNLNWNEKDELELSWNYPREAKQYEIEHENKRNGRVIADLIPGINNKFTVKNKFEPSTNYTIKLFALFENGTKYLVATRAFTSPPKRPLINEPKILYSTNTSIVFFLEDLDKAIDKNGESYMIIKGNLSLPHLNQSLFNHLSYDLKSIIFKNDEDDGLLIICKNNSRIPIYSRNISIISPNTFMIGDLDPCQYYKIEIFLINRGQNGTINKSEKYSLVVFTEFNSYDKVPTLVIGFSLLVGLGILIMVSVVFICCYIHFRRNNNDIMFVSKQNLTEDTRNSIEIPTPQPEEPIYQTIDELEYDYVISPADELKISEQIKKNSYLEVLW